MNDAKNVETKYVCEVDDTRGHGTCRKLEKMQGYAPKRVVDMREVFEDKDVDAVVVATPGQWHALASVWACQAGKDVYVEKCISMSIWEGRKMIEAAQKYNSVIQCGMQTVPVSGVTVIGKAVWRSRYRPAIISRAVRWSKLCM